MYTLEFTRKGNFRTMSRPCGRTLKDAKIAFENQVEIFKEHNEEYLKAETPQYYINNTVLRNKETNEIVKEYSF